MFLRKLKENSLTILITTLVIAAVILLNVFTGMLTDRYFLRADITETGLYTLSDEAAGFLSAVSEPVEIIVLAEESTWLSNNAFSHIVSILQNYSAASGGHIRVQYVNPDLNTFDGPFYNNNLSVLRESHSELEGMDHNDIIFISSRRATRVFAGDLFVNTYDRDSGRFVTVGLQADQELVGALSYVLNESIARAVFVINHQENSTDYIKFIFSRSGYVYDEINLATDNIPEDTLILITAGPKIDFLSHEIMKLEQYLVDGGSVMVLYDFGVRSLPTLDLFLSQWGISVDSKLVFDEDHNYIPELGVIGAHVVQGALPFTVGAEEITLNSIPLGVYLPRPLSTTWVGGASGGFNLFPLIQTFSASSYAKELSERESLTWEREREDESGPFVLAYNTRRLTTNPQGEQAFANLIVAGAGMFEDDFLGIYGETFFNTLFIAGLASDLNPFGDGVYIPSKLLFDSHMLVSSQGARNFLIYMVIGLPVLIIAAGVVVWLKRRNL